MKNTILGTVWVLIIAVAYVAVGFHLSGWSAALWFGLAWMGAALVAVTPFIIYGEQDKR